MADDKDEITDPKQLTNIYKKNGSFDNQRKKLLNNFKSSETHHNLLLKLKVMIENKIKNDPSILMKNKGIMGALIQGEILSENKDKKDSDGSNTSPTTTNHSSTSMTSSSSLNYYKKASGGSSLLSIVDKDIQDKIIDSSEFHKLLRDELKDIRRKLLGISDDDYKQLLQEEIDKEKKEQEEQRVKLQLEHNERANNNGHHNDYRNNFRIKHLNSNPHKVTKPRFNFNSRNSTSNETDGSSSNSGSNNNSNNNNNNDNDSNDKPTKSVPFMMY
ncbi:complex proteins associated with Set1p component shg1-domain-containing protein [Scheffersomyces coipomensis]|uniref:complex proteins associated with Set1p component shg1-domain-containing protein n=1 Tax=Scheffersomyces coipomensis TaxID=1788519 RepID=UPI00315D7485